MTVFDQSDLADLLDYASVRMWIDYFQEDSGRTGTGDDIVTDLSDPVWRGEITLDQRLTHAQAAAADARLARLGGVIGRFYMTDPRLPYPIMDPDGSGLGSRVIRLLDIHSNRNAIRLKNLADGYQLKAGDRFHCDFGTDPVHRGYFWICNSGTANSDGETGWMAVAPNLFTGIDENDIVELRQPSALWRLEARSMQPGAGQGRLTPGASFKIVQVL